MPIANEDTEPRTLAVWPLAVAQTLSLASIYYIFPALLPEWERELGWSRAFFGSTFTGTLLVSAPSALLIGFRNAQLSHRPCTGGNARLALDPCVFRRSHGDIRDHHRGCAGAGRFRTGARIGDGFGQSRARPTHAAACVLAAGTGRDHDQP